MACRSGCGGRRSAVVAGRMFDPTKIALPKRNARNMYQSETDDPLCEPYHGAFTGTMVFVAGLGTEHEKFFLSKQRYEGLKYAAELQVSYGRVNVISFCHDRIVSLLGA